MNTALLQLPFTAARRINLPLRLAAFLLLLALPAPLLAVVVTALIGGESAFLSLSALWYMLWQTLYYVGGVLLLALALALPTAWAVVMLNFRGRQVAVWLLFLPFALPPYITAYTYSDMLRDAGIGLPGSITAIITTALAVYPYIFFLTRNAFIQQHCHIQSAARLLGCSSLAAFWRVSLPLARPAIVVGITLAAMETLNDIAVAEHFGVQTLGIGIYDLWLNRGDLVAGVRLAVLLCAVIFALVWLEEHARAKQSQYSAACDKCYDCERAKPVSGGRALLLWLCLLLPSVAGFWLPVAYLLSLAAGAPVDDWLAPLLSGLRGSITLAALLVLVLALVAVIVVIDKRFNRRGALMRLLVRLARVVYALPGTVIAQGIFLLALALYTISGWQVMTLGGIAVLTFACTARFFILAAGTLETGMDKISPQLDAAARLTAISPLRCFFTIHFPLLRPAMAAAAVMICLEGIKELPMTLILRPFNFDTLAVVVYQYTSDEALELAAPSALLLALLAAVAATILFLFENKIRRQ